MRLALLATVLLAACAPADDAPAFVPSVLGQPEATLYIPGVKRFTEAEIAAGVQPSPAILAAAEAYCPTARLLSATSTAFDPRRIGYFFSCA